MVSEEQIQRFFAKQCTAKEAEQIAVWLKAHPEQATAYFEEAEWQNAPARKKIPEDIYVGSWQYIQAKIKARRRHTWLQRSAIAASIAICFAAGIFYFTKKNASDATVSSQVIASPAVPLRASDTEYNFTGKPRLILLTDGSVVSLWPKAIVWFDTPFAQKNTRDIYLEGEARFEVAKNKQKPFTVFSGSFSITALGTAFIVKKQPHAIRVQLLHGKVVIQNTEDSLVKNWNNIYLLPGQQMTYSDNDALAKVSSIQEQNNPAAGKQTAAKAMQRETTDSLIFNGSPMAMVLQKLHDYYHVEIRFDKKDIKNSSFTGVIVKKDSVQTILKAITQMNGLLMENTDSSFIISKERN